ncbi:MAG: type II toxin-antitoxin system death-on-curing family toxin [Bosea sp. (in: a-proteobacteria)]|uniref:type II toxin-antitoxin system death-on-curing family toxin n=1 Tax=Bosea sp. (in: a-proteobacteria) TaxID=1871050 RepID=UPI002735529A|nr:type II toxin-antitoxin system death-on-curing family toxin [Bosea sp. (in: a-proteobacteria)]MDP3601057.1 type II toxin-antitoxin system death-on-curing family toxin [Bosea sp. (in: a-proteobacteria)]
MSQSPEPIWLLTEAVIDIHTEQLAMFGGPDGVRDLGLLESALARPINRFAYGETDLAALAASYAFGIARNHPFIDGNKRVALLAMVTFLGLNNVALDVSNAAAAAAILALAAGDVEEEGLTRWIRDNWPKDAPA